MQTVKRKIVFVVLCCFGSLLCVHAQPALKATVDRNDILIGEQLKLTVTATLPKQDFFIKWIEIPDTLEHFELVEKSTIDSSFTNQKLTGLSQTLTFTSFDSGLFVLPSFNANFSPSTDDTTFNLVTDSFAVKVSYVADSTNTLRDIKTIREVNDAIPIWYWIAGAAGLLLLIGIGIWIYRHYKKGGKLLPTRSSLSAYQLAITELEKLKELDLSSPAAIKQYHTKLPEILKQYLAVKQGAFYGSSTTSEILILLNQKNFDKAMLSETAAALRCSDAVKFAKFIPERNESEKCSLSVKAVIDFVEQQSNNTKN